MSVKIKPAVFKEGWRWADPCPTQDKYGWAWFLWNGNGPWRPA